MWVNGWWAFQIKFWNAPSCNNWLSRDCAFIRVKFKNLKIIKSQVRLILDSFLIIFLSVVLIIAAVIDIRIQKIPNLVTFPTMLIALVYHFYLRGLDGLLFSAGGLATGIALLIVPYLMGGMGAGDAKLMGAIGGMIGAKGVFIAFIYTAIVGGVYALVLILIHRQHFRGFFKKQMTTLRTFILTRKYIPDPVEAGKNSPKLCYGLAIALGTGIYIILDLSGYQFIS
jgi:prepilin peptidase CpaA